MEIVDNLAKHLDPKPIVIAERFKFHKAEQQESESIRDFLARLKKLTETCEFGGYREEAIRGRFVCGLKERTIRRKLLAVADLTLQSAVEKACAAELTEKETIALHGGGVEEANKVRVTFPECFVVGKSTTRRIRVSFAIPSAMVAKRLVTLLKNVLLRGKTRKVGRPRGSQSRSQRKRRRNSKRFVSSKKT